MTPSFNFYCCFRSVRSTARFVDQISSKLSISELTWECILEKNRLSKIFLILNSVSDPYQGALIWIRVAPKINQNHGINKSKWFVNVLFAFYMIKADVLDALLLLKANSDYLFKKWLIGLSKGLLQKVYIFFVTFRNI